MNVVSGSIRYMRIFVVVPLAGTPSDSGVVDTGQRFVWLFCLLIKWRSPVATPTTTKQALAALQRCQLGLPSGTRVIYSSGNILLSGYPKFNGCEFHWLRENCRLEQWKVYRFGAHNILTFWYLVARYLSCTFNVTHVPTTPPGGYPGITPLAGVVPESTWVPDGYPGSVLAGYGSPSVCGPVTAIGP